MDNNNKKLTDEEIFQKHLSGENNLATNNLFGDNVGETPTVSINKMMKDEFINNNEVDFIKKDLSY